MYESIRSCHGYLNFCCSICIMYTSGRWQAASVMPCRQIWVLSNLHPPVAEPALCQYWASGPLWSVSQGELPRQVTNMCKINFKSCTPFAFWAFQRGTALVPYSAETDLSQVFFLRIKHISSHLGQALSTHMHGTSCLMDIMSAALTLLLFALLTLMHCGEQHVWHSSNRQLPRFDMFLHLMLLHMHRIRCRGCLSCTILKSTSPWQNGL